MSRQYNNFEKFLKSINFKINTEKEDFIEEKKINKFSTKIEFLCIKNHKTKLTIASFINKKSNSKYKKNPELLCSMCCKINDNNIRKQKLQKESFHKIISCNNNKITYNCFNCKSLRKDIDMSSFVRSMKQKSKFCVKCQNDKYKLNFDDIKNRVVKMGMKLLTKPFEYKNNKMLLHIICSCGNENYMKLSDIERGRHCKICKNNKSEELCRKIFCEIFKKDFVSCRPLWLEKLELDGYCEELNVAFEYNGIQHYYYCPDFFHKNGIKDFFMQIIRDKKTKYLCNERGVKLYTIPYIFSYKNEKEMRDYILKMIS